jgi:hypothetical protein
MAARLFYVYALVRDGVTTYVGKGSGRRMSTSKRRYGLGGHEVARFMRERDAYDFEIKLIAETKPALNRNRGGGGPRRHRRRERSLPPVSRQEVAWRMLNDPYIWRHVRVHSSPSSIEALREIANGARL